MKPSPMIHLTIWALMSLFSFACEKNTPTEISDNLVLRHKGADMPIWVRGNVASGKMVLYLHGGPGECAMCLRDYLKGLEKDLAMVYWDQRIAGSASGNASPATLTYPQFAEDLQGVLRLLKQQYPEVDIYLFGHSFGVEMAWQFLTTGDNQNLVQAFIALNGTFSTFRWLQRMREWVLREAAAQNDEEARQYMEGIQLSRENMAEVVRFDKFYPYMFRLGGNPVWPSDDKGYVWKLWFGGPHSKLSQVTNVAQYDEYYRSEIFRFDREALLEQVRIPVALFWGVKDGIMPIELGFDTQKLLKNAPTRFVQFEESWHTAFHTETEKFREELLDFIREN